jgi:hypothetical protein
MRSVWTLKDKGVDPNDINDYLLGIRDLPEEVSARLKLNPSFTNEKVFPDYETAVKYGLTPKYTHPAQLLSAYKQELDTVVANKQFINTLVEQGKIVSRPKVGYVAIDLSYAPANIADAINGLFRDEDNLKFGALLWKKGGNLSRIWQDVKLSAGIPLSTVNFFAIGQTIKAVTTGVGDVARLDFANAGANFAAVKSFFRANSNKATIKWFESKSEMLSRMSAQGIDLSNRMGHFERAYKNMVHQPKLTEVFGKGWQKVFSEKTFASFMPMLHVQTFETTFKQALKKGLSEMEAEKLAADTTRKLFGLLDDMGRTKGTEDVLSAIFFAPKYRESIIKALWNSGRSIVDPRTWKDASYAQSRSLALGMALTFGMYDGVNYAINGQHVWENEKFRKFAVRIPMPNGQIMYVDFMPGFLSMPRNIFAAGEALVGGDIAGAAKKGATNLSIPIQVMSQILGNEDYFGNPIYNETDSASQKVKKWASYLGLQSSHPYFTLVREQFELAGFGTAKDEQPPLLESLTKALEFPVKWSNVDKVSRNNFYDAIDKKAKESKKLRGSIQEDYEKIKSLAQSGDKEAAQKILDTFTPEEKEAYRQIKASDKQLKTNKTKSELFDRSMEIADLVRAGNKEKAQELYDKFTDEEKKAFRLLKENEMLKKR